MYASYLSIYELHVHDVEIQDIIIYIIYMPRFPQTINFVHLVDIMANWNTDVILLYVYSYTMP